MNTQSQAVSFAGVQHAEERVYPLGKLKKSPRNVRKVAHTEADIEARAASIKAKGLISPLVVEPELGADGAETGYALVTAGEGRRLALRLLAKRKVISKTTPVRCLVDRLNDPQEVSLDENVSRSAVIAVQVFVCLIEFKLTTLAGFVLVPFGLFGRTAFLAERVLGNVIAAGIKVLVLAVVVGIGASLFSEFTAAIGPGQPDLETVLALALASVTLLGLSIFGPGIASGLVSGAPQLGAGAAVGTGLAVGGMAMAGAAGVQMALGAGAGLAGGAATAGAAGGRPGAPGGGSAPDATPSPGAPSAPRPGPSGPGAANPAAPSPSADSADGDKTGQGGAPAWARELQQRQTLAHGAGLVVHAVGAGDGHGAGAGPSLSEENR